MLNHQDKSDVQKMIDESLKANNDVLMDRIGIMLANALKDFVTKGDLVNALSNFVTKDDLHRELERFPTRDEFNELKDDVAGIRTDLNILTAFTQGNFRRQERDIGLIKAHLNLG